MTSFQQVVAATLSPHFVSQVYPTITWCYSEALAHVGGYGGFDDPERRGILPYWRRCLVEFHLRKLALDSGMYAAVESTDKPGHEFTLIQVGTVRITVSKTDSDQSMPETCGFRKQHSSANDMLRQMNLLQIDPVPKVEKDGEFIYAIITHGPALGSNELGYVNIGFPRADMKQWLEPPVSILEIQERQARDYKKPEDAQAEIEERQRNPALKEAARKKPEADTDDAS